MATTPHLLSPVVVPEKGRLRRMGLRDWGMLVKGFPLTRRIGSRPLPSCFAGRQRRLTLREDRLLLCPALSRNWWTDGALESGACMKPHPVLSGGVLRRECLLVPVLPPQAPFMPESSSDTHRGSIDSESWLLLRGWFVCSTAWPDLYLEQAPIASPSCSFPSLSPLCSHPFKWGHFTCILVHTHTHILTNIYVLMHTDTPSLRKNRRASTSTLL